MQKQLGLIVVLVVVVVSLALLLGTVRAQGGNVTCPSVTGLTLVIDKGENITGQLTIQETETQFSNVTVTQEPTLGTFQVNETGFFTYSPRVNESGTDVVVLQLANATDTVCEFVFTFIIQENFDAKILSAALSLAKLQRALLSEGLDTFTESDFTDAGFHPSTFAILQQIELGLEQQINNISSIINQTSGANSTSILTQNCTYNFTSIFANVTGGGNQTTGGNQTVVIFLTEFDRIKRLGAQLHVLALQNITSDNVSDSLVLISASEAQFAAITSFLLTNGTGPNIFLFQNQTLNQTQLNQELAALDQFQTCPAPVGPCIDYQCVDDCSFQRCTPFGQVVMACPLGTFCQNTSSTFSPCVNDFNQTFNCPGTP